MKVFWKEAIEMRFENAISASLSCTSVNIFQLGTHTIPHSRVRQMSRLNEQIRGNLGPELEAVLTEMAELYVSQYDI